MLINIQLLKFVNNMELFNLNTLTISEEANTNVTKMEKQSEKKIKFI